MVEEQGAQESVKNQVNTEAPGSQLRAARESRSMSVSHIASLLRLDSAVITALEADDTEKLPSATFVKGYLRAYARLVGLDGELLVAAYGQQAAPEASAFNVSRMDVDSGAKKSKWLWVFLLVLLTVVLAWFWSKPSDQPVSTDSLRSDQSLVPQGGETAVEPATVTAISPASQLGTQAEEDREKLETADEVIEQLLRGLKDPTAPTLGEQVIHQSSTDAAADEASAKAEQAAQKAAEEAAAQKAAKLAAEQAAESKSNADEGLVSLRLQGKALSWVSIRDAREQRIFRDNLDPGEDREISGKPPMVVNLGNGAGVVLYVNGKLYDHSAWHKPNGTARFVLNPTP